MTLPADADALPALLDSTHAALAAAVTTRHHPWRTPTLATVAANGTPQARTIVLRGCDPALRRLLTHSDRRAAKVAELARQPRAALLFWDPAQAVQLRIGGAATLHTDDALADDGWAALPPGSRAPYAAAVAPGTAIDRPALPPGDPEAGRGNFAVLALRYTLLERLDLLPGGHRRARFAWEGEHRHAAWIAP